MPPSRMLDTTEISWDFINRLLSYLKNRSVWMYHRTAILWCDIQLFYYDRKIKSKSYLLDKMIRVEERFKNKDEGK